MKFRARHPRQILNEIKWRGWSLEDCEVEILHRGAPKDTVRFKASEIILGRSFFQLRGVEIPYHRINLITYKGKTVFSRLDIVKGALKPPKN